MGEGVRFQVVEVGHNVNVDVEPEEECDKLPISSSSIQNELGYALGALMSIDVEEVDAEVLEGQGYVAETVEDVILLCDEMEGVRFQVVEVGHDIDVDVELEEECDKIDVEEVDAEVLEGHGVEVMTIISFNKKEEMIGIVRMESCRLEEECGKVGGFICACVVGDQHITINLVKEE
ncbi:hypothetical protein ZIOFF_033787 [Zingiber officinale]|uniref:Uncharacterized protein n=1 Tax=Zingiber officinale TaxID=94328 RepID=A0A8J5GQY0_ZINOF|nr:hypothetical protein ZIOFF_033787 [Zingiber officinale]